MYASRFCNVAKSLILAVIEWVAKCKWKYLELRLHFSYPLKCLCGLDWPRTRHVQNSTQWYLQIYLCKSLQPIHPQLILTRILQHDCDWCTRNGATAQKLYLAYFAVCVVTTLVHDLSQMLSLFLSFIKTLLSILIQGSFSGIFNIGIREKLLLCFFFYAHHLKCSNSFLLLMT